MKKQINAEIIADSMSPDGTRLTSFVLTFPRIVLAEFNTHRVLSRNSASSRAIPYKKMLEMVKTDPFIPIKFQKDHTGMQGTEYFEGEEEQDCIQDWLYARDMAVKSTESFKLPVTKQLKNRILEPFMWHTVIATATDWENYFALRAHDAAEIHIDALAQNMLAKYNESKPKSLNVGDWHIPFGDSFDEFRLDELCADVSGSGPDYIDYMKYRNDCKIKIATARCARVSYLNYEGKDDYEADVKLFENLKGMGHMSPFEHCAMVPHEQVASRFYNNGNFSGQWTQLRKTFTGENKTDDRVKEIK